MASEPEAPEWERLEPASALINLLPDLWRSARSLWWVIPAILVGGSKQALFNVLLIFLLLGASIARTLVRVATLRYRVSGGRLEIQLGLLSRQHRSIDPARIQNIEVVRNPFHRIAGLAELRIDTAGEGGTEGLLSAITVEHAQQLRALLSTSGAQPASSDSPQAEADPLLSMGILELVGYGLSSARVGMALVAVNVFLEGMIQFIPGQLQKSGAGLGPMSWVGVMLIALAGSYLVSTWRAFTRYGGFKLVETPRGLATESGLFTRTRSEIIASKVQCIRAQEPLLRRLLGYGSLRVETARVFVPNQEGGRDSYLPMVHHSELGWASKLALPELSVDPWATSLRPPATRALFRGAFQTTLRWTFFLGVAAWWMGSNLPLSLLPLAPLTAFLDWRRQGWALTSGQLITRSGFFTRSTLILPRRKLQRISLSQDPLEKLAGLARIHVRIAGAEASLPLLDLAVAQRLFLELVRLQTPSVTG